LKPLCTTTNKEGFLQKETKQRFSYWEDSRGAYVLSQKYRNELKNFYLTELPKLYVIGRQLKQ